MHTFESQSLQFNAHKKLYMGFSLVYSIMVYNVKPNNYNIMAQKKNYKYIEANDNC